MSRIRHTIFSVVIAAMVMGMPLSVAAWDPFGGACNGAPTSSAVCTDKGSSANPLYGPNSTILKVTDFIAVIAGIAAIIMLLIGALKYVTAGGDSKSVASAKSTIVSALIGIAVIVSATAIITFVVSRL